MRHAAAGREARHHGHDPQVGPAGPTAPAERALGPDLARGFMLLFIALANSHYVLRGDVVRGGFPMDGSRLDSAVTWLIATFVDGRAFPMSGLLFGYGVAHIAPRNEPLGPRGVRRRLWRRALALIGIGFAYAMLLYIGDIPAAYGVLLPAVGPIGFACPFLVGLLAGRARVLERPDRYRRLFTVTAVAGIAAAVLGAQPAALMPAGVTDVPDQAALELIGTPHDTSGLLGGFGYAALIRLVAARLTARPGRVTEAVRAAGQRSMTCYVLQSVVWAAAFTPFLLDLSGTLTVAGTALLAAATWLATVAAADRMRRTGRRGPFEVLVRRLAYGRPRG